MGYLPAAAHNAGGRGVVADMGALGVGMGAGAEGRVFRYRAFVCGWGGAVGAERGGCMREGERVPGEGGEKERNAAGRKVGGGKSENSRSGRSCKRLPWVGFSPKKALPPEKAILVSRPIKPGASLSCLPKKAILASDERLERAISGDRESGRESKSQRL